MSWQSLALRINDLPLVLAGPILRRVTPGSASVWLALKDSVTVKLIIREVEGFASEPVKPVTLGSGLHIVCVTAKSPSVGKNLKPGVLYTYDIEFGNGQKLADVVQDSLSYADIGAPSFVLPPVHRNKLRVCHGS